MKDLLPTKVFKFRGKKYRWTCTRWEFVLFMILGCVGLYFFALSFYILDMLING